LLLAENETSFAGAIGAPHQPGNQLACSTSVQDWRFELLPRLVDQVANLAFEGR
jgi:hypothetical protein